MKPNKLRQLIKEGKPTLGVHAVIPWPSLIEIMGATGAFDYIEYIGEYSTYDLETFENLGPRHRTLPQHVHDD